MRRVQFAPFHNDMATSTTPRARFVLVRTTSGYTVLDRQQHDLHRSMLLTAAKAWANIRAGGTDIIRAPKPMRWSEVER